MTTSHENCEKSERSDQQTAWLIFCPFLNAMFRGFLLQSRHALTLWIMRHHFHLINCRTLRGMLSCFDEHKQYETNYNETTLDHNERWIDINRNWKAVSCFTHRQQHIGQQDDDDPLDSCANNDDNRRRDLLRSALCSIGTYSCCSFCSRDPVMTAVAVRHIVFEASCDPPLRFLLTHSFLSQSLGHWIWNQPFSSLSLFIFSLSTRNRVSVWEWSSWWSRISSSWELMWVQLTLELVAHADFGIRTLHDEGFGFWNAGSSFVSLFSRNPYTNSMDRRSAP